ncbi:hypothetical protein PAXRUDRAFT_834329 [Paxillus rubicundulus Ve08.2h10]|uniref:Uncharacterized protein n=1 Tax=Paxillus rubicundulus Ve08.2h10 TaxID=930991 RepID=A0A0D0DL34_9AGAM|nr:hypothetical protein PAXRUDRAFT_834329 [Paxillus rubicundulus Ve08.2h10]
MMRVSKHRMPSPAFRMNPDSSSCRNAVISRGRRGGSPISGVFPGSQISMSLPSRRLYKEPRRLTTRTPSKVEADTIR